MRSVFIAAAIGVSCGGPGAPVGAVAFALADDACARYCGAVTRAELYRVGEVGFPLGPPVQVDCGEPMTFSGLPAGTQVFATLEVFDAVGTRRLAGTSDNVTVPTDDDTAEATIHLEAEVVPHVTSVSPEPVVVADGPVDVVMTGDGLSEPGSVAIDGIPIIADWAAASVQVQDGVPGGELVVESCGIPSRPVVVRVIGSALGRAAVSQVPGCTVVAVAADGDDVLAAFDCGASPSYVQRLASDGSCPLDGDDVWSLPGRPTALAPGFVGLLGGGLATFEAHAPGPAARVDAGLVRALAASDAGVFGIVDERLVQVDAGLAPVAGIESSFVLVDVAALGASVMVLAASGDEARLIELTPPGEPLTRSVSSCHGPRAFAVDGDHWVLACTGEVVVVARGDGAQTPVAVDGTRVVLDPRGDVAFIAAAQSLTAIDMQHVLHTWATPGFTLLGRLADPIARLVTTVGGLEVWTPYDARGPCP